MSTTYGLQVTEANHTDNAFYTLGGAAWDTEAERQANLATIPAYEHDCDAADRCYILDILDPADGMSIVDDREISEATALTLLGVESFDDLRERERAAIDALVAETFGSADPCPGCQSGEAHTCDEGGKR